MTPIQFLVVMVPALITIISILVLYRTIVRLQEERDDAEAAARIIYDLFFVDAHRRLDEVELKLRSK